MNSLRSVTIWNLQILCVTFSSYWIFLPFWRQMPENCMNITQKLYFIEHWLWFHELMTLQCDTYRTASLQLCLFSLRHIYGNQTQWTSALFTVIASCLGYSWSPSKIAINNWMETNISTSQLAVQNCRIVAGHEPVWNFEQLRWHFVNPLIVLWCNGFVPEITCYMSVMGEMLNLTQSLSAAKFSAHSFSCGCDWNFQLHALCWNWSCYRYWVCNISGFSQHTWKVL